MTLKIYGDSISGNCLKVKYTADLLKLDYEWQEVNILNQESRTPEYLAMSPAGQVPVIKLESGEVITQSNAIIRYFASGSSLLPEDYLQQARVDEWLFWEQYSHEPYIAVCRFQMRYLGKSREQREGFRVERGEQALDFMDSYLRDRDWFANDAFSIADIALYAYTHMAEEGGFDLSSRTHLVTWLGKTRATLAAEG